MDRSERSAHDGRQGEGTAGSDPGHCGGGRGRRQSDRPGSRERAGQMVDVAKLNVQLFDLNGEFNDILRQMGQVM